MQKIKIRTLSLMGLGMEMVFGILPKVYPNTPILLLKLLLWIGIILLLSYPLKILCEFFSKNWLLISKNRLLFIITLTIGLAFGSLGIWLYYKQNLDTKEQVTDWSSIIKKPIIGKQFMNERVELDGFSYNNCEFKNVTFVYKGIAPFDKANCKIIGSSYVDTSYSEAISSTVKLLKN